MDALGGLVDLARVLAWLAAYIYVVVFIGVLIDASGFPFPGRILLVAAGAFARAGHGNVLGVIVLAAVAAMIMDLGWFLAARWGGDRVLAFARRLTGSRGRRGGVTGDTFERYGAATIVIGRFFTSVRAVGWPVAATQGVGYVKFFVLDVLAAGAWASAWVLLGWAVGTGWQSAAEVAGYWMLGAGALIFAVVVTVIALRLWRRRTA